MSISVKLLEFCCVIQKMALNFIMAANIPETTFTAFRCLNHFKTVSVVSWFDGHDEAWRQRFSERRRNEIQTSMPLAFKQNKTKSNIWETFFISLDTAVGWFSRESYCWLQASVLIWKAAKSSTGVQNLDPFFRGERPQRAWCLEAM